MTKRYYIFSLHKCVQNFKNYQDTILLVDKGEKQVSSTLGHDLMLDHPFAEQRFRQAKENLSKLIPVFKNGDLSEFIKIVESEALSLHAMMMTSRPYFILMKPNTLQIINHIWKFREETGSNVCFTLDAGANVHVLYPEIEKETVLHFIKKELSKFCKNEEFIEDEAGLGAEKILDNTCFSFLFRIMRIISAKPTIPANTYHHQATLLFKSIGVVSPISTRPAQY